MSRLSWFIFALLDGSFFLGGWRTYESIKKILVSLGLLFPARQVASNLHFPQIVIYSILLLYNDIFLAS